MEKVHGIIEDSRRIHDQRYVDDTRPSSSHSVSMRFREGMDVCFVNRDTMERPFRCLDPLYRQELIRVYLSNVETICRRFIEQKQSEMAPFLNEMEKFKLLWDSLDSQTRKKIVMETEEAILKGIVKQFFNEKEVTTTLLMDALFCGCKQIDDMSRRWLEVTH